MIDQLYAIVEQLRAADFNSESVYTQSQDQEANVVNEQTASDPGVVPQNDTSEAPVVLDLPEGASIVETPTGEVIELPNNGVSAPTPPPPAQIIVSGPTAAPDSEG